VEHPDDIEGFLYKVLDMYCWCLCSALETGVEGYPSRAYVDRRMLCQVCHDSDN
jgi:hypothetical protein